MSISPINYKQLKTLKHYTYKLFIHVTWPTCVIRLLYIDHCDHMQIPSSSSNLNEQRSAILVLFP